MTPGRHQTSERVERAHVRVIADGRMGPPRDGLDQAALTLRTGEVTWIDLTNPSRETLAAIGKGFRLHPLIVEELTERHRTSDVRVFDGATFAVLRFPRRTGGEIETDEVQVVIGEGYLLTAHASLGFDLDEVIHHWEAAPGAWRSTSSSLLYALLRQVMDIFVPAVDHLSDRLDTLQHHALLPGRDAPPRREVVGTLFSLTEQITDLHNMAAPTMDMIHSLQHNSDWFSHAKGNAYTRDVLDDARHLTHRLEILLATAGRLFDMVNSLITLHRADVEGQLTLVATIFLPLTLLSSYFGQNFRFMINHVDGVWGFLIWGVGGQLAALAIIMLVLWKVGAFR